VEGRCCDLNAFTGDTLILASSCEAICTPWRHIRAAGLGESGAREEGGNITWQGGEFCSREDRTGQIDLAKFAAPAPQTGVAEFA